MTPDPSAALPRTREMLRLKLKVLLTLIQIHDGTDYPTRNHHVMRALACALDLGYRAGVRLDPAEPQWPCVYIDLPTGQVSWHVPEYPGAFDGHTTAEKYARCVAYAGNPEF